MYLYETHCHTLEGSRCASLKGEDIAKIYAEKGYQGIIITDHFYGGNTAVDKKLDWHCWVECFAEGYRNTKRAGEALGLQVFLGWEYNDNGTELLTYGLDEEWLHDHPEAANIDILKYSDLVRVSGGILIHAHPFRQRRNEKIIRLLPQEVDGVEVRNKSSDQREDHLAEQYAENYNLVRWGGTDFHRTAHASTLGGIALPTKASSVKDIFDAARAEKIRIL